MFPLLAALRVPHRLDTAVALFRCGAAVGCCLVVPLFPPRCPGCGFRRRVSAENRSTNTGVRIAYALSIRLSGVVFSRLSIAPRPQFLLQSLLQPFQQTLLDALDLSLTQRFPSVRVGGSFDPEGRGRRSHRQRRYGDSRWREQRRPATSAARGRARQRTPRLLACVPDIAEGKEMGVFGRTLPRNPP